MVASFAGLRAFVRMWRVCKGWWLALQSHRFSVVQHRPGSTATGVEGPHWVVVANAENVSEDYTHGLRVAMFVFASLRACPRSIVRSVTVRWTHRRMVDDGELVQSCLVVEEIVDLLASPENRIEDIDLDLAHRGPIQPSTMKRLADACATHATLYRLVLRLAVSSCYLWLFRLLQCVWQGSQLYHFSLTLVPPAPALLHTFFVNKVFNALDRDTCHVPMVQNLYLDLTLLPLASGGIFRLLRAIGRLARLKFLWLILDHSDLTAAACTPLPRMHRHVGTSNLEYIGISVQETQLTTPGLCNLLKVLFAAQRCEPSLRRLDCIASHNHLNQSVWHSVNQCIFREQGPWRRLDFLKLEFSNNLCGPCDVEMPVPIVRCKPESCPPHEK